MKIIFLQYMDNGIIIQYKLKGETKAKYFGDYIDYLNWRADMKYVDNAKLVVVSAILLFATVVVLTVYCLLT